jgi:hypothetical protein
MSAATSGINQIFTRSMPYFALNKPAEHPARATIGATFWHLAR